MKRLTFGLVPLYFLALLFISGCVRDIQDIPPQLVNNPIFNAQLSIDGDNSFGFMAGEQDIIMYTELGTTADGIGFHRAKFIKKDCVENCGKSLAITFYETLDTLIPSSIDQTLANGAKPIYQISMEEDSVLVELYINDLQNIGPAWFWNHPITGQQVQNQQISFVTPAGQTSEVCLNAYNPELNCLTQKCSEFTPEVHPDGCNATLKLVEMEETFVILSASSSGTGPFVFDWGNGPTSEYFILPINPGESKAVSLDIMDVNGCLTSLDQVIRRDVEETHICPLEYGLALSQVEAIDNAPNGHIDVEYIDDFGEIYRSNLSAQSSASFFEIVSNSDFELDPNGFMTKQVTLSFDLNMADEETAQQINMKTNAPITIAIPFM